MSSELEQLRKEVDKLSEVVKKQNLLISKTGQNLLELQITQQKADVASFGEPKSNKKATHLTSSDYATNEDLVQLVAELQGQLDTIEDRSIRRIVNSHKSDPSDIVAPIPNADSEILFAEDGLFPKTLKDFEDISDIKLFKVAKFYELVPPSSQEEEEFEKFLEGKVESFHISDIPDEDIEKQISHYKRDQLDDVFNDVARYLGLRSRRGTDVW
ncbi:hypothetical protein Kpol_1032p84 [Vanderwaltozyma polyspora DSM 70294]|uniref:Mrp8p n=1 Tax=Vanderwaltozyma polyspora (strain ATCC 22028 / DSM 70294 / BCRC 21397 / CBS 2163 / NBRC 10782 / NRRL Y-8283 / UCD 57-17) TaxID=436907 RepID=A7TH35_VANPO|nr:uncharacterized protein Kpol_1032p84 [Vanderwaltozyma polyspora DSM 70294]EDO18487.1 hypothetical protein Kpol_1032p84 [Vanderwaltozyma polyspora DSM 70294]